MPALDPVFESDEPLPIFTLGLVLFPGAWLPLRVFEARYVDMTRGCLKTGRPFGVSLIVEGREVGSAATPHNVGSLAYIEDCDMHQMGMLRVLSRGGGRFRIKSKSVNSQGLVSAKVEAIADPDPVALPEAYRNCAQFVELAMQKHGTKVFPPPHDLNDVSWVGYRLAEMLPLPPITKQRLLEMTDPLERLAKLQEFMTGTDPNAN